MAETVNSDLGSGGPCVDCRMWQKGQAILNLTVLNRKVRKIHGRVQSRDEYTHIFSSY